MRTSCKKQLIRISILGVSSAKFDSPQLIDVNGFLVAALQRAHKLSALDVEGINFPTVGIVGDQQRIAQRAEMLGATGQQRVIFCARQQDRRGGYWVSFLFHRRMMLKRGSDEAPHCPTS